MQWKDYIAEIFEKGVSQSRLANLVGCGQTTISDLASGKTREPRYSLGTAILAIGEGYGVEAPDGVKPTIVPEQVQTQAASTKGDHHG